jgi:hypothetical protein
MNDDKVLQGLRARRADPATRIDMSTIQAPSLYEVASASTLAAAEEAMGLKLPALLERIYAEVGNGGFGPGGGLIGLMGGYPDSEGRVLPDKYEFLRSRGWKEGLLPLWDWGDAAWSCIDASTLEGNVITMDESGYTLTRFSLASWLEGWIQGVDLHSEIFEIGEASILNPFTRRPMTVKRRVQARGKPL